MRMSIWDLKTAVADSFIVESDVCLCMCGVGSAVYKVSLISFPL